MVQALVGHDMIIRIPVPDVKFALEFDSDKITGVETPREVVDVTLGADGSRRFELAGPNSLILHFATLDDLPKWVEI